MLDLNAKAYDIIGQIELYYQNIVEKLHACEQITQNARQETEIARFQATQAQQELAKLQEAHLQELYQKEQELKALQKAQFELQERLESEIQEKPETEIETESEKEIQSHVAVSPEDTKIVTDNSLDILLLQEKITEIDIKNQALEEKYQSTYRLLQKEMVKVDTMQMELELAQRERDIALRKQSMTPEQKQLLIKLEHENYKIHEVMERIDYISDSFRKILGIKQEIHEQETVMQTEME